jgi:hypothetical protein
MNEGQVSTHLRCIADDAVPATVDVWCGIEEQIAALPRPIPAGQALPRKRLAALAAALVLLLALALGSSSSAAASGRDLRTVVISAGQDVLVTFGVIAVPATNVTVVTPNQCTPIDPQPAPLQTPQVTNLPAGWTPAVPAVMMTCTFDPAATPSK